MTEFNSVTRAELARQLNGVTDGTDDVVVAAAAEPADISAASPTAHKAAILRAFETI